MIVDCHTHLWTDPSQLGEGAREHLARQGDGGALSARPDEHARAAEHADKTLVLGLRSRHLGAEVPNEWIAEYVAAQHDRMIGVAAVDPTDPAAADEAGELLARPEFRGLTISPSAQSFHPSDSRAVPIYELAQRTGAPLFFEQGTHFPTHGRMEYARPLLLDEIADQFPDLTIVISALGHPWVEEGIALIGKHPRVFAEISPLLRRGWQAYNAMVLAYQFNVMDKILFGSDFPFSTASQAIKSVYRMGEVTQGTNLPTVPREALRGIVERNALAALGIARAEEAVPVGPRDSESEDI